ncbi:hypothetical protein PQX77_011754 [Marasmius sp. AFHP31]|nr:hypothetical protein PQX77_011754 [Marasmius sp. AFHP31]
MSLSRFSVVLLWVLGLLSLGSQCVPVVPTGNHPAGTIAVRTEATVVFERIHIVITLDSLVTDIVKADFVATNPTDQEITLEQFTGTAGVNETTYMAFNHTFSQPLVIPAAGDAASEVIPDVLLTQGAIASLDIIPLGILDLLDATLAIRTGSVAGQGGEPGSINGLKQSGIPTTYDLDLGSP